MEKTFLLISIYGNRVQALKEGGIKIIQSEKKKLKKLPQYKGYHFQVRTKEGFAAVKILYKNGKLA